MNSMNTLIVTRLRLVGLVLVPNVWRSMDGVLDHDVMRMACASPIP